MTDTLDQRITDGMHRAAADIALPPKSFGDVRRRVRARRSRHVAAALLPAVVAVAWVGTRPTVGSAPGATGTASGSSEQESTASISRSAAAPVTSSMEKANPISIETPTTTADLFADELCTVARCDVALTSSIPVSDAMWADRVSRSTAVFEALGFPAGEHAGGQSDVVQIHAADPARPNERQITLTISATVSGDAPATTINRAERTGVLVSRQANDGWFYELEVVDTAGTTLPTGDQIMQLLAATFG